MNTKARHSYNELFKKEKKCRKLSIASADEEVGEPKLIYCR